MKFESFDIAGDSFFDYFSKVVIPIIKLKLGLYYCYWANK